MSTDSFTSLNSALLQCSLRLVCISEFEFSLCFLPENVFFAKHNIKKLKRKGDGRDSKRLSRSPNAKPNPNTMSVSAANEEDVTCSLSHVGVMALPITISSICPEYCRIASTVKTDFPAGASC